MDTTQSYVPIDSINDNIVFLKDGSAAVILKTTAVNFGLLSGEEQLAIIGSFAQMLNSLSFAIQIVIRSKRLDITSYIKLLDKALQLQVNPLLAQMMVRYRDFIQSLIKDNEVLDKSFYVILNVSGLEIGIGTKLKSDRLKKVQTILGPRRDQIIRQLSRVGLNATQLKDEELVKLFYDIYNTSTMAAPPQTQIAPTNLSIPSQAIPKAPAQPTQLPPSQLPPLQNSNINRPLTPTPRPRTSPFIVEELTDSP